MSKDNYDNLADFCGPKGFYNLDGDGHIDAFEAAMMASDVEEQRANEHTGAAIHPHHRGLARKIPEKLRLLRNILQNIRWIL